MGRVVHFEVPVDDIDRADKFFSETFGWRLERQEGPWGEYTAIITGDEAEEGINGAYYVRNTVPPENAKIINFIDVTDLDEHMEKIKAHGGELVFEKMVIKGVGYMVYFKDPGGNILGMMERDETAGMEEE